MTSTIIHFLTVVMINKTEILLTNRKKDRNFISQICLWEFHTQCNTAVAIPSVRKLIHQYVNLSVFVKIQFMTMIWILLSSSQSNRILQCFCLESNAVTCIYLFQIYSDNTRSIWDHVPNFVTNEIPFRCYLLHNNNNKLR